MGRAFGPCPSRRHLCACGRCGCLGGHQPAGGLGSAAGASAGGLFAVDMINSTRILTFTFEKILANYLCYLMVFALLYAISRRVWVTALAGGLLF